MTTATAGVIAYRAGPDALYLNITNRCSNACAFCLRAWCDGLYGETLRLAARARGGRGHAGHRAGLRGRVRARGGVLWLRRTHHAPGCGARRHRVAAPAAHPGAAGHQRPRRAAEPRRGRAGGPGGGRPARRERKPQRRRPDHLRRRVQAHVRQGLQGCAALCRTVPGARHRHHAHRGHASGGRSGRRAGHRPGSGSGLRARRLASPPGRDITREGNEP